MQRRLCFLTSCCGVPVTNPFWELGITSLYLYHQGKNALGSTFSNKRNLASSHLTQPILIPAPALDHYCAHPHLPAPTCPPALSVPPQLQAPVTLLKRGPALVLPLDSVWLKP